MASGDKAGRKLYVSNLPAGDDLEGLLQASFSAFGAVEEVFLLAKTGRGGRRSGFITMADAAAAEAANAGLQQWVPDEELGGTERATVKMANGPAPAAAAPRAPYASPPALRTPPPSLVAVKTMGARGQGAAGAAAAQGRKLYVSNLPEWADDAFVAGSVEQYGAVAEIFFLPSKGRAGGRSAFVTMADAAAAAAAQEGLQAWYFTGDAGKDVKITVKAANTGPGPSAAPPAIPPQPVFQPVYPGSGHMPAGKGWPPAPRLVPPPSGGGGGAKLYVSNLPNDASEEYLRQVFSPYGEVGECVILHKRAGARDGRLSGFVNFATADGAAAGLELNGIPFDGGTEKMTVRPAPGGGGGGKGGWGPPPPPLAIAAGPGKGKGGPAVRPPPLVPLVPLLPARRGAGSAPPPAKRPRADGDIHGTMATPIKLYVANVDVAWDDAALAACFASYGDVLEASLLNRTGKGGLRSGFVWIRGAPRAQAAVAALNGAIPDGALSPLTVRPAREAA